MGEFETMAKKILKAYPVLNVKVTEKIKERLDSTKVHHRETYNEVIKRLLDEHDAREK